MFRCPIFGYPYCVYLKARHEFSKKKDIYTYERQWIAEQYIPRRVIGEIVGDLFERLVDYLIFILFNLMCLLIDQIYQNSVTMCQSARDTNMTCRTCAKGTWAARAVSAGSNA